MSGVGHTWFRGEDPTRRAGWWAAKCEKWAPLDGGDQPSWEIDGARLWAAVSAPAPSLSPCLNGVVSQGPVSGDGCQPVLSVGRCARHPGM